MATLTLSNAQPYLNGAAGGSKAFGYDANGNRVVRYTFKTGSNGASKVTLSGYITKYSGDFSVSTSYPIRFKITKASTGYESAGASSSYDGSITSTTVNVTVSMTLQPSTTYYLWLFPGHSKYSLYYAYDTSEKPTLSIITEDLKGVVYIDNGTSFDSYQIYIDNGSSWDLYIPYIDNGSSWDLYS